MIRRAVLYLAGHRLVAFIAIFFLSFVVRVALLLLVPPRAILQNGESSNIARTLVSKGEFGDPYSIPTGPTAHTTPFYPVVVAVAYRIFGTGYAGNLVRCLFLITSYSVLYALFPTIASAFELPPSAGLVAGFTCASLPIKRAAEVFRGWEEPCSALALAYLLLLTLRRNRSGGGTVKNAVWLGLCWGLAFYISFNLASILVGLFLIDLFARPTLRTLRDVMVTAMAAFVVMFPWVLRNHHQLHGWTLMRDNLGLELRVSNHDHARPSATLLNLDSASYAMHPTNNPKEAIRVRELGELEYNRQALREVSSWISAHPHEFVYLSAQRFFYFWFGPPQRSAEFIFSLVVTTCYTFMGLAGLSLVRKIGPIQFRIWCVALIFYPMIYYFVQYINRYRVPIDWMIWLSAGLVFTHFCDRMSWEKDKGDRIKDRALQFEADCH